MVLVDEPSNYKILYCTCSVWMCRFGLWLGCISWGFSLCLHLCWKSSSEPAEHLHHISYSYAEIKDGKENWNTYISLGSLYCYKTITYLNSENYRPKVLWMKWCTVARGHKKRFVIAILLPNPGGGGGGGVFFFIVHRFLFDLHLYSRIQCAKSYFFHNAMFTHDIWTIWFFVNPLEHLLKCKTRSDI